MSNLNAGPINPLLLHSNDEHRAKHVFNGGIPVDKVLTVRRSDRQFWEILPGMHQEVLEAVMAAGFQGIIQVENRKIDHALITALVERWRPETHTFHLPIGEATVTLQDVEVLWGLRVDGIVVTGSDMTLSRAGYINMCEALMGFTPPPNSIKGGSILLSCLLQEMNNPLPENPTHNEIEQKTRVVIMHLFGGTLFPNNTGNRVGMYHLYNLINLEACVELSWGSAVLACLYRRLCKATHYQASDVSGPLGLLQLWSWERFNNLAPTLSEINFHFQTPYGARWNVPRSYIRVTSHVLQACRSQLASLTSNEMGGISQFYNQSTHYMGMDPPSTHGYEMLQNTANQFGQYVQGENWMRHGPSHFQENYQPGSTQHIYRTPRENRQEHQPVGTYSYAGPSTAMAGPSHPSNLAYDFLGSSNPYTGPSTQMAGASNPNVGGNLDPESQNYYTPFPHATTDFMSTFSSPQNYFRHQDMGQAPRSPGLNFTPVGMQNLSPFSSTHSQTGEDLGDDGEEENIPHDRRPRRNTRRPGCGTGGRYGDH